jgi:hypothetical protein
MFFSPEQSYTAALHQDTQDQQPQATQTDGKSMKQHLPQQEIQKTSLSVPVLQVATVVQQLMIELIEAVSEEGKLTIITETVLNLMKQNGCWSS